MFAFLSLGKTASVCDCFMFCCLKPERSTWKKHGRACVVGLMEGGVKVPKEPAAMSPRQQEEPNDQGDQDEVDNDKGQHSQTLSHYQHFFI